MKRKYQVVTNLAKVLTRQQAINQLVDDDINTIINDSGFKDYSFINDATNIKKSGNPDFFDIANNQLFIGDDSDAKDFGDDLGISTDVIGTTRIVTSNKVDIGAYQHIVFPD